MAYLDFSNKRYSKDQLADLRAMMVKLNSSTLVPEEAGSVTLDEFKEWLEETVQDYVDDNQEDLRGPAGDTGPQGSTGVGISNIENYYAVTSTNISPTLSEITSSTIPALSATNKYLWRKEVVNFTNGTSTSSIALICVQGDTGSKGDMGNTGPQGPQGPAGSDGINGVSAYVHIKYAGSVDENTGIPDDEDMTGVPSVYMGIYSSSSPLASDTASDYTWMLIGANAAAAYSKDEVDDLLDLKANQSDMDRVAEYLGVDVSKKRNLFDGQFIGGYWSSTNGVFAQTTSLMASANPIPVKPNADYFITGTTSGVSVRFYKADGTYISLGDLTIYDGHIQTPSEASVLRFHISPQDTSQIGVFEGTSGEYVPYIEQLVNLRQHSNRNLLDNPWFTVNQRGQTSYTTAYKYTVDRWIQNTSGSSVDVSSNGITLKKGSSSISEIIQKLESPLDSTKTYTISASISDGSVVSGQITPPTTSSPNTSSSRVSGNGVEIYIYTTEGQHWFVIDSTASSVTVRAVKLELGSSSTLANDAPPNYAEELAKCQRYFYRLNAPVSIGVFVSSTNISSTHKIFGTVQYPVPMRVKPTFTNSDGVQSMHGTASGGSLTSPTFTLDGNNQIGEVAITSTSLTAVDTYYVWKNNGYWEFSADL